MSGNSSPAPITASLDSMQVLSISQAARELGCGRSTLYRAIKRGDLNALDTGSGTVIIADEKWEQYEPEMTGRRAEKFGQQKDDGQDA